MASFSSVSSSVAAAVLIEQDLQRRQSESEHELRVRIGISAGEPVTENEDLFGAAVQLASRLCSCSDPAAITVSVAVRELCIGKHFEFEDRQPVTLKGFPEPVQVYGVRW